MQKWRLTEWWPATLAFVTLPALVWVLWLLDGRDGLDLVPGWTWFAWIICVALTGLCTLGCMAEAEELKDRAAADKLLYDRLTTAHDKLTTLLTETIAKLPAAELGYVLKDDEPEPGASGQE